MRVSIALHTKEPPEDGNQRQGEARYGGYNRQYADMEISDTGDGVVYVEALVFPAVATDPEIHGWFSVGDPNGGAIIIAGPIEPPMVSRVGQAPTLKAHCGIFRARLVAMGLA